MMVRTGHDRTMYAAIIEAPGEIKVGDRPYPVVVEPTDAVVRVVLFRSDIRSSGDERDIPYNAMLIGSADAHIELELATLDGRLRPS